MNILANLDWHSALGDNALEGNVDLLFVIEQTEVLGQQGQELVDDPLFQPYLERASLPKISHEDWTYLLNDAERVDGGPSNVPWVEGALLPNKEVLLIPNEDSDVERVTFFVESQEQQVLDEVSVELDQSSGRVQGLQWWRRRKCHPRKNTPCLPVRCLGDWNCIRYCGDRNGVDYFYCECERVDG